MSHEAEIRRRAATRAFVRYFILAFLIVGVLSGLIAYALMDARSQHRESLAIRIAYCTELEGLKKQNRVDLAYDKKNFKRNLALLGIPDTPALRTAVRKSWARKAARNAPKSCPYKG